MTTGNPNPAYRYILRSEYTPLSNEPAEAETWQLRADIE